MSGETGAARPPAIILAGGEARRMGGGDKGLLLLGGRTLLDHALARLRPQVGAVALNANGDPARFETLGLEIVPDASPDRPGPLAGVLAGMDWAAARGATHVVTAAWDTPFFPEDLVPRLQSAAQAAGAPIALAATPDPERGLARHPTFGLWDVSLRDDLRQALARGVRKVVAWADPHGVALARFDAAPHDPFFNVNRPEDLAAAEALLRAAPELAP